MYKTDRVSSYHVPCPISTPSVSNFSLPLQRRKSCDLLFKCLRRFSPHNRHLKPDSLPQDTRNASFFQPETVIIQSKHRCLPGRNREQGHMYDRLSGRNLELLLHMDRGSIGRSCKAADMRRICQPCIHRRGGAAFKNQEDIGLPSSREHTGQPLCYPQLLVLEQQPSPTASGFQQWNPDSAEKTDRGGNRPFF